MSAVHLIPLLRRAARKTASDTKSAQHRTKRSGARLGLLLVAATVPALVVFAGHTGAASAALPTGTGIVLNAPIVDIASTPSGHGYWEVAADGGIFTFGQAGYYGSTGALVLNEPIVGMESAPGGRGYWEVASDGGIFAFGGARFYGSTGAIHLNQPIVGIDSTPGGKGYWMVAADGGIFSLGDARFYGSASGMSPLSPIVGMASTPDGHGYWEAAADGAVYAFGDAQFAGNAPPGQPLVAISSEGPGYRLAGQNGGVFTYGGSRFFGSLTGHLNRPIIAMSSGPHGYLTASSDGGAFAFGRSAYFGSLAGSTIRSAPVAAGVTDDGITAFQRAAWDRVNMCEEGGNWNVDGLVYSGGLGFSHTNWDEFNTFGYPTDAADATPDQQIRVAVAFATRYWGNPNAAPDQNGCSGGY